jgi:hypothetical protein
MPLTVLVVLAIAAPVVVLVLTVVVAQRSFPRFVRNLWPH